ncbi:MAG: hydrogenase [Candidatus Eisenbacteria bacterium]|uniref:Hydrogenase n=1 Tax=Eiseniibacteriota bacterium TaxID=2212470 RepID=A0A9D6QIK8_UNCEI|nr:hydrogenase [Candidatus Eisenbacteria bacterium]MBI3539497.1 hydrogenase [Candidatus Eisenbacteria bacterium]
MTVATGRALRNRRSIPWAAVPCRPIAAFRSGVIDAVGAGARLVSLFGLADGDRETRLVAVLADDARGELDATSARVEERYPALTPECPQAHVFEREVAEQCAVTPEGHPWLKPLRRHPPDHLPSGRSVPPVDREDYPFFRIDGDELHEVGVGPVHAGIIEPGHFRFHAHGERVLFLEIVLGYQHRGVERLLETLTPVRAMLVAESIAGDTVIGHAEAWCGALEALGRVHKSPRAQAVRAAALELERLAAHIGDLGAMAGDIAYAPAAATFGRLRGDCLNLLLTLSGNRYGRGLVRPGGVAFDVTAEMAAAMVDVLTRVAAEFARAADDCFSAESVQARYEGVGVVPSDVCRDLGLVGAAARACGFARDVRSDHPWGAFRYAHIPIATAAAGDVAARAVLRRLEVERSLEFLIEQIRALPRGVARADAGGPLAPEELAVALVEGWRGEIAHVVLTDERGAIRRAKIKDPSFHNWSALAAAMPGNTISDFPLCNKSFNLSYAGHDL